ncbi:MAG TPA: DoxX family protein [Paludibacter sp.]|nr:DoxX family protein [Paludibacter sp.]
MNTIKRFFATDPRSWSLLFVRVALGIVILPHGMQKALGSFGGYGFAGTIQAFHEHMGLPVFLIVLVILAEFVGSLGVIVGFATRFMALSIFINFLGAMILGGHVGNGFFMNFTETQKGEGMEFFILILGMALALVVDGAGRYSIDSALHKRMK